MKLTKLEIIYNLFVLILIAHHEASFWIITTQVRQNDDSGREHFKHENLEPTIFFLKMQHVSIAFQASFSTAKVLYCCFKETDYGLLPIRSRIFRDS